LSFILDALRKAENKNRDRHKMTVPTGPRVVTEELPEVPPAQGTPILLVVISSIVIAGLVWWLLRESPSDSRPVSETQAPEVQNAQARATNQPESLPQDSALPAERPGIPRETGARALDREAQRGTPAAQTTASTSRANGATQRLSPAQTNSAPAPSGPAQRVTPGTVRILNADGTVPDAATPGRVKQETLPEYRHSLTSGGVPIPQLHLDMHVYSAEPEKRFVFINLDKYGEGDAINDDTSVESIEPRGAVINHKGYRFVLLPD